MRIQLVSVFVDDQDKALKFYTDILGFKLKHDQPAGSGRWITLVSPEDPNGIELLLEPKGHPATEPFTSALKEDGVPFTQFAVDDVDAEYERLKKLGVEFPQPPVKYGRFSLAVFDDTVGNLIQLIHVAPTEEAKS